MPEKRRPERRGEWEERAERGVGGQLVACVCVAKDAGSIYFLIGKINAMQ